jgi:hypothetical protein
MSLFDLKDAGQDSVRELRAAMIEFVENLHGLLDRLEVEVHFKLNKRPKEPE